MPSAVSTPLEYPQGASGEAVVVLELTLSAGGDVTQATAVEGSEPFSTRAVEAAKAWKFQPATRDGTPVAAKIRFQVRFVPPRDVEEPPPAPEPATPSTPEPGSKPATPPPPAEPTYEIVIVGERGPIRHELARTEIERMPGAFGDAFRAIEALPGVVPIVSGLPYFYVRGAPPGNVGYFFDGIPVPFLYHFGAGPSVFHPAFVDHVDLYPGAYPVRYGRFAGAIVAGEMAPPSYRLHGEWNIRILDSGLMLEAPFADGKGVAMVGGRFSYTGAVVSLFAPGLNVGYWDYQARARYEVTPRDTVEVLGFGSGDYTTYKEKTDIYMADGSYTTVEQKHTVVDINFHRLDLRWDHRLNNGNWRNALMLGRDRTGVADGNINLYDHMVGWRSEYWKQLDSEHRLRAGADVLFESLSQKFSNNTSVSETGGTTDTGALPPGGTDMKPAMMMPGATPPATTPGTPTEMPTRQQDSSESDAARLGFGSRKDLSVGLYSDVVWQAAPQLLVTPGLRTDLFISGKNAAVGVDPRITAEYQLSKKLKVVHGLALVHQAPNYLGPVPGLKSSLAGGLQRAVQSSAGVNYELPAGISSSLAVFQTAFFNMTDLLSLVQLENTNERRNTTNGEDFTSLRTTGHAYGFELLLRRSLSRRLGGFLSYTLSHSRRFSGRLSGPATTDRTHVLNVAASYDLGRNWRFGARFMIYTGIPAQVAYIEAARNPPRTPAFWRIDFKLEKRWYIRKPDRWFGFNIEVLNTTLNKEQLLGSCNAFSCKYEEIGPVTVPSIAFEGAY